MRIHSIVRRILLLLLLISICFYWTEQSFGFGPPWEKDPETLREFRDSADALVFGEVIHVVEPNEDKYFPGRTAVRIQSVIKDESKKLVVDEIISFFGSAKYKKGEQLLILGDLDEQEISWIPVEKCTAAVIDYLNGMPQEDAKRTKFVIHCLNHLEHVDPVIAQDAFLEVSNHSILDAKIQKEISNELDRAKLRNWLTQASTQSTLVLRVELYSVLLGLCGNADDGEFLKQLIIDRNENYRIGLQGIVTGYLLKSGKAGLSFLDDHITSNNGFSLQEKLAVYLAIRRMDSYELSQLPRDELCQSLQKYLKYPNIADMVIIDLARLEDWSVGDQLMQIYFDNRYDNGVTRRAIVRYYISTTKSWDGSFDRSPPAHFLNAKAHLKTLEKKDPKTVRQARMFYFD